jgi:hypothetical protein
MTIVALCLAGLFGFGMVKAWKQIDELEKELDTEVERYEMGWTDGYEVGRSEVQKRVRKVKTINGKEK